MPKTINPPEHTKAPEECKFRIKDRVCCNAVNYLRPHKCNAYCVEKVDSWLRKAHPELDEEEIREHVARITQHQSE